MDGPEDKVDVSGGLSEITARRNVRLEDRI